MKINHAIIILSVLAGLIGLPACASKKPSAVVVRGPEKAEATPATFMSRWVRDRAKDYAAEAARPPIQLRNKHVVEAFNEEYKIPGE